MIREQITLLDILKEMVLYQLTFYAIGILIDLAVQKKTGYFPCDTSMFASIDLLEKQNFGKLLKKSEFGTQQWGVCNVYIIWYVDRGIGYFIVNVRGVYRCPFFMGKNNEPNLSHPENNRTIFAKNYFGEFGSNVWFERAKP